MRERIIAQRLKDGEDVPPWVDEVTDRIAGELAQGQAGGN